MRWLDERPTGHDQGSAAAKAIGALPSQRRKKGSARTLGLDANTVGATIGGSNYAEARVKVPEKPLTAAVCGVTGARSVALQLAGGVRVEFGEVTHKSTSSSSSTNTETSVRDISTGHDLLSFSFLEISLAQAGSSGKDVAVRVRREFTKLGEVTYEDVFEEGA
jgi:hypothetical protein